MKIQEFLNQKYPTKEDKKKVKKISSSDLFCEKGFEDWELDLSEFTNIKSICINGSDFSRRLTISDSSRSLTKLNVNGCINLQDLSLPNNNLTDLDFLSELPNPEKLSNLEIYNNNIKPTNIAIFSKFVNLYRLKIGTMLSIFGRKHNKFYGSFESWKDLIRLETICIEATDVDSGLEYLPFSLVKSTKEMAEENKKRNFERMGGYSRIECSPHNTNAKCKEIQDRLRPFNYDLEAWQLAHPHKIYKAKPEIFLNSETKIKWLTALRDKTAKTQQKITETKTNEPRAVKRIKRLEMKLDNLKLIQENISNHALIDKLQEKELVKKEDKETQTEEQYITLEIKK